MTEIINTIITKSKKKIQHLDTERILCYSVDVLGNLLSGRTISKNNQVGYSYLDKNKLIKMMCDERVHYMILVHNHPRSTTYPSEDDDNITKELQKFVQNHNITLYDHLIIMKDLDFVYSYRENKRIFKTSRTRKSPIVVHKKGVNV